MLERIRAYAGMWLESPGGSDYASRYAKAKWVRCIPIDIDIRLALKYSRRAKKSSVPYPPAPIGESIALYDGQSCITWNGLQLVDVLLPSLSAVETGMGTGITSGIRWIRRTWEQASHQVSVG